MAVHLYPPKDFPPGMSYCTVLVELPDITGEPQQGDIRVEVNRKAAWSTAPHIFSRFSRPYKLVNGSAGIPVPHTDQTGFVAVPNAPALAYKFTLTPYRDTKAETLAYVQIPQALGSQVYLHDLVDLGSFPAGSGGGGTGGTVVYTLPNGLTFILDADPGDEYLANMWSSSGVPDPTDPPETGPLLTSPTLVTSPTLMTRP